MGVPAVQVPLQPRLLLQRHVPPQPDAGGAEALPRRRAPQPEGRRPAGPVPGARPRLPLRRLQRPRQPRRQKPAPRPRRLQAPPLPAPRPHGPEADADRPQQREQADADRRRRHGREEHGVHAGAADGRRGGVGVAPGQGLRERERLLLAPGHQPLAQHARGDGAVRDRHQPAAQRDAPRAQAAAAALPRHHEHQRPRAPEAHQRRRHLRDDRLPAQVRHRDLLQSLRQLELHRAGPPRRPHQARHGRSRSVEPLQGAAADRGLPVRLGRAGRVARHRAVGDGVPGHLLPQRRRAAGRRGAAGVVEGGARGRARRPQGRALVAQDADGAGAREGLHHHHLDRVGATRCRQLRAVPVLRVPPEPAVREPAAHAGAGLRRVQGAGEEPGEVLRALHHRPIPGRRRHLAAGDPVQPLLRRGVPRPARHQGVDVGRQGAGGVQAVRRAADRDRETRGGHEQGPALQEPLQRGPVPLHPALPQHLRQGR
ncbi:Linoleate 9S-lipoxygenase 1 [Zea mays]|uniref:Linoleate 9S-lipoxygenase 1 n=1 Tax=Zea mays TaxID=4577 RepID=A0A1D6N525_MAIZE|nr:Linoleate 9S-lipoxygenase 1 [Zea mays]